jgi:glycosyltransferase involved in cell wall biosynthesis
MKILLVSNYTHDRQNSMQFFAKMLDIGLRAKGHEVRLIRPEPFFGSLKPSDKGLGKWLGYLDKFLLFPIKLRAEARRSDVIHICDHSNAYYVKYVEKMPHVITCNDMLAVRSALGEFPQNPIRWTGKRLQRMIVRGLKRSKRVICISKATRDDVLRITGLASDIVSVVYMGLNYDYSPMDKEKAIRIIKDRGFDIREPFLLHVGKGSWYKNRSCALKIFDEYIKTDQGSKFNMIFAGTPLSGGMIDYIREQNIQDRVSVLTGLDQESLKALYSLATALIFPSIAEGFGWPIIEAQACGCPVFTSNKAPMTEVGGNGAVYFDPDNPKQAARIIADNLSNRAKVIQAGFDNVKKFTSYGMIDEYLKVYNEVLVR